MSFPTSFSFGVAVAVLLFLVGGCDPTVDSFEDNGLDYSIFGYLNASADTQYVRVEPLRDSMLVRAPERMNVEVTLTHLATGRTVSLRDSVFRYLDQAAAHNFYTTAEIEPRGRYRLEVSGPDGTESRAQTTVPDTFPTPTVIASVENPMCDPSETDRAIVRIRGIERLVAVKVLYYRSNPPETTPFNYLPDTLQREEGMVLSQIDYGEDICKVPPGRDGQTSVYRAEVVVAAGDPNWPDFSGLDPDTKALPRAASNVNGGIGYLGGVVTDTVVIYPQ